MNLVLLNDDGDDDGDDDDDCNVTLYPDSTGLDPRYPACMEIGQLRKKSKVSNYYSHYPNPQSLKPYPFQRKIHSVVVQDHKNQDTVHCSARSTQKK